jgi:hypothetical protein
VDPVPDPLFFFLVVPGIEPGPLAKNSDHTTTEAVKIKAINQRNSRQSENIVSWQSWF